MSHTAIASRARDRIGRSRFQRSLKEIIAWRSLSGSLFLYGALCSLSCDPFMHAHHSLRVIMSIISGAKVIRPRLKLLLPTTTQMSFEVNVQYILRTCAAQRGTSMSSTLQLAGPFGGARVFLYNVQPTKSGMNYVLAHPPHEMARYPHQPDAYLPPTQQ